MEAEHSHATPGSMVLLTRLAKQVYRRCGEQLLGMQLRQLMALSYLRDHEGSPQQELAEALCMDANNIVLLLNELEELRYVARRRDPADRRRHLVDLTAAGRRALKSAERAQESIEEEVLDALDAQERATLRQLLARALYGSEPASTANEPPPPAHAGPQRGDPFAHDGRNRVADRAGAAVDLGRGRA